MTFRFLASYAYCRNRDIAQLHHQLAGAYGGPVEMFADSGAFSAATLGTTIKLADYAAWLHHWRPLITTAATLDVIGDPAETAANTERLHAAGLDVLPTFHVGTDWPVLAEMCARHRYVALGGMVPHSRAPRAVLRWLIEAFRIAQPHGTRLHGFGQTTPATVAALPFYSVDSSTWSAELRHGHLPVFDTRLQRMTRVPTGQPAAAHRHARLLRAHGLDPATVGRPGFAQRAHRDKADYDRELQSVLGAAAAAFQGLEQALQQRHRVPPPPGHRTAGTVVHLAEADPNNLLHAAAWLGTRRKEPPR